MANKPKEIDFEADAKPILVSIEGDLATKQLPEIIRDGVDGVLVEDFTEGCYRLDECFNLERGLISMTAGKRFNYLRMTYQYVQVYREAIMTGSAGPGLTESAIPCVE